MYNISARENSWVKIMTNHRQQTFRVWNKARSSGQTNIEAKKRMIVSWSIIRAEVTNAESKVIDTVGQ
jgi:hypothetical protein